jgi:hypothetical protein
LTTTAGFSPGRESDLELLVVIDMPTDVIVATPDEVAWLQGRVVYERPA